MAHAQDNRKIATRWPVAAVFALAGAATSPAMAQSPSTTFPFSADGVYNDIETKYIFGFTNGSDTGAEGEKAIEFDNNSEFKRRGGRFRSTEQEVEFEGVPTQFFAYELSLHGLSNSVKNVPGLDNVNRVSFSGASTNLKYLLIGRGPGSPIGLSISAEPEWSRVDGTSGMQTRSFSIGFNLAADTELIANRLFAAANFIYEPERAKEKGATEWENSSTFGVTTALAWRFTPKLTMGGELEYYRAYDSLGLGGFQGHALYAGPTLHYQITPKIMLAAAFSTQVAGRAVGETNRLDLTNFSRYHARLKVEFEF